jgi:hypothetical protein
MAESVKRWKTTTQSDPGHCHPDDRMGDECTSSIAPTLFNGAQCFRIYVDGSRSNKDHRDRLCAEGQQGSRGAHQLPVSAAIRKD